MKRSYSLAFIAACFLYGTAFATLADEKNKYRVMYEPYDNGVPVANVARDSSSTDYKPNPVCGSVSEFTVTNLRLKNEYHWQGKDETGSPIDHYHCLFRIVDVNQLKI